MTRWKLPILAARARVGGVVLGVAVADLIIQTIGTGGAQLGVMVVLAMSAAILLGGGELLVVEAAVSAILLVALDPGTGAGFSPNRILEAIIGGGAALAVTSLFFPPDPTVAPGRAAQAVFVALGRSLERIAAALEQRDPALAERALVDAREIDDLVRAVDSELAAGRETARYSPPRRAARAQLDRYDRSIRQLDFAVRNTRVLARHALRLARAGESVQGPQLGAAAGEPVRAAPPDAADPVPAPLPAAVRDLALAVWELAAAYDAPAHADQARRAAVRAAAAAAAGGDTRPQPGMPPRPGRAGAA